MHPPLSRADVEHGLRRLVVQEQLQLIRLRNNSEAFDGALEIGETGERRLSLTWRNGAWCARLEADLLDYGFTITHTDQDGTEVEYSYG